MYINRSPESVPETGPEIGPETGPETRPETGPEMDSELQKSFFSENQFFFSFLLSGSHPSRSKVLRNTFFIVFCCFLLQ